MISKQMIKQAMPDKVVMDIEIVREADQWPEEEILLQMAKRAIGAAIPFVPELGEAQSVNLLFADDSAVQDLNNRFRGKDKPTNVLSFPGEEILIPGFLPHLGDIAFAYETIIQEAENEEKAFEDHLTHLVIHGMLHLVGFDHEEAEEAEEMEELERIILKVLEINDPYA